MKVSPISTETGISELKSVLTIVRIPKVLATPSQLMGRFYQNIPNGTRKSEACGEPGGWGAPTGGGGQTSRPTAKPHEEGKGGRGVQRGRATIAPPV